MTTASKPFSAAHRNDAMSLLLLASPLPLGTEALPRPVDGGAALARAALETGLAAALYAALLARGGLDGFSQEVREGLEAAFVLNSERNSNLLRQMRDLDGILRDIGIGPVFLKGSAILLAKVYPVSGARLLGDLDVLVPPERIEDAVAAAQSAGYRSATPDHLSDAYRLGITMASWHAAPLFHPDLPGTLELHRAFDPRTSSPALTARGILSGAVPSDLGGLLRPSDTAMMGMALTHWLRHVPVWGPEPLGVKDCLDLLYLVHADPALAKRTAAQDRRLAVILDIADRQFARHGVGRPLGTAPRLDGALASLVGRMLKATGLWPPLFRAFSPRLWSIRLRLAWHSRAYRTHLAAGRADADLPPSEHDLWHR